MAVYLLDGEVLTNAGEVATSEDCCCGEIETPCCFAGFPGYVDPTPQYYLTQTITVLETVDCDGTWGVGTNSFYQTLSIDPNDVDCIVQCAAAAGTSDRTDSPNECHNDYHCVDPPTLGISGWDPGGFGTTCFGGFFDGGGLGWCAAASGVYTIISDSLQVLTDTCSLADSVPCSSSLTISVQLSDPCIQI